MREAQEEQRMLLDRISGLQLQLSEVSLVLEWKAVIAAQCWQGRLLEVERKAHVIRMWSSLLSRESFLCVTVVFFCCKSLWSCNHNQNLRIQDLTCCNVIQCCS